MAVAVAAGGGAVAVAVGGSVEVAVGVLVAVAGRSGGCCARRGARGGPAFSSASASRSLSLDRR
ncbi:MAG: hypothetical protein U0232_29835 [Thermomicrobiales bacterium]